MSEDLDPAGSDQHLTIEPRNNRILIILAVLGVIGTVFGIYAVSARFGIALFLGVALAFANYFWMRRSLKAIFATASEGVKPSFIGAGYFLRYLAFGSVIAIVYLTDIVPVIGLLFGMTGFGIAVMLEGFILIFLAIFGKKEI